MADGKEILRRQVEEGDVPGDPWKRSNLQGPASRPQEYILGFEATVVPPGVMFQIARQPNVPFLPERLVIPSSIAEHFMVVDVQVGAFSQFVLPGELPAVLFSESYFGVRLKMVLCSIDRNARIAVRNISDKPQSFMAALIGMEML